MSVELRREINAGKALFEQLVLSFGMRQQPRFTQDSPVRTSVWTAYADRPDSVQRLILVPNEKVPTPTTVATLLLRLAARQNQMGVETTERAPAEIAEVMALPTSITATLGFDDLLVTVLPMTSWWHEDVMPVIAEFGREVRDAVDSGDLETLVGAFRQSSNKPAWRFFAIAGLIHTARTAEPHGALQEQGSLGAQAARWRFIRQMADLLMRLGEDFDGTGASPDDLRGFLTGYLVPATAYLDRVIDQARAIDAALGDDGVLASVRSGGRVWSINLNRPVEAAVARSRRAVKADAAAHLFGDESDRITWAVIDSGIDATHTAFFDRTKPVSETGAAAASRIKATYDFDRLRALFSGRYDALITDAQKDELRQNPRRKANKAILAGDRDAVLTFLYQVDRAPADAALSTTDLAKAIKEDDFAEEVAGYLESVKRTVIRGRMIDWPLIEPLISIPHDAGYQPPAVGHGTHVAGTLMGHIAPGDLNRRQEADDDNGDSTEAEPPHPEGPIIGICPKMHVYDLRVTNPRGGGEEFVVQAALQFVGYLNRNRDQIQVHGINVSLSLAHDVANYACGLTPVCLECERLIGDGVVVVAAAGNKGFQKLSTESGLVDAYNPISITDPGNADGVITVGATHRDRPHSYGVSYFSSRGPTGDGRQKPDLVAPGEKIISALPGNRIDRMDGTSMAAPHVSGAAALLMARHTELIGQPARIKQILCDTATDLKRKREFQGAGLLDILRALQSV